MFEPRKSRSRRYFRSRGLLRNLLYLLVFASALILLSGSSEQSMRLYPFKSRLRSKIGKCAQIVEAYAEDETILANMALHRMHDERFGYTTFLFDKIIVGGFFDRYLHLMSIMTTELSKEPGDRLEWLMWHDSDITLMNPTIPLEVFLPPDDHWGHIHLLVCNDHNGLNNGAFFIKIHPWSIKLLRDAFSIKSYEPDVDLEYSEQTALELWVLSDAYREHVMHVPQRWFNSYVNEWSVNPVRGKLNASLPENVQIQDNTFRKGDLQIHFAGIMQKVDTMKLWLQLAQEHRAEFEIPFEGSALEEDIQEFWRDRAIEEDYVADRLLERLQEHRHERQEKGLAGQSTDFEIV